MKRIIAIVAILLLPTVLAESFPNQNLNSGFVGWQLEQFDEEPTITGSYRLSYPSIADGEEVNMAQNGPFAVVVFFADESEDVDQYIWLQDELALWGYISLVVEDGTDWDDLEYYLGGWNNGTFSSVPDAENMFALNHISFGGHGTGAHFAAEIVKSGMYGIDGLFGLGLEGASTSNTVPVLLSRPSSALFLTGTTDDIAPADENVLKYLEDWPGAWQVMHPLCANHIGYQESDTFWERLADGDSNMGREQQQIHVLEHILPYLNLSLRGDDDAYQAAFNREDKSVSSDDNSYFDEDLSRSRLYQMENISSTLNPVMLNQSFTISSSVTMRDDSPATGNVSCLLPNGDLIDGVLQNGLASCTINGSSLSPGPALIELRVADYSFSDWLEIIVTRVGMPLEVNEPLPNVSLDQHSSVIVYPDLFASDPDGEELIFFDAQLVDDNSNRLLVNNSVSELSIAHVADQEWDGTVQMNLTLAAGQDMANITVNVTVLPVNDPVIQTTNIPQQLSVEDGENIVIDFSNYVSDPEGEELEIVISREYPGLRINSSQSVVLIDPQVHWNGAELLEFHVSDGVTEHIQLFVPINIEAVDDPIELLESSIEVEMDEDGVLTLQLENYTVNVDNDELTYSISGQSDIVTYSLSGSELVLIGNLDLHGTSQFEINVSDGFNVSSMNLTVTTKSVPDLPVVGISSIDVSGGMMTVLWTISDSDGDVGLLYSVTLAGESIEDGTECTGDKMMTCITQNSQGPDGTYSVEVKVWDGHAQEWSNTATQDVEFTKVVISQDDTGSEVAIGDWVLPIGLGLLAILLVGYLIQSRKQSVD